MGHAAVALISELGAVVADSGRIPKGPSVRWAKQLRLVALQK